MQYSTTSIISATILLFANAATAIPGAPLPATDAHYYAYNNLVLSNSNPPPADTSSWSTQPPTSANGQFHIVVSSTSSSATTLFVYDSVADWNGPDRIMHSPQRASCDFVKPLEPGKHVGCNPTSFQAWISPSSSTSNPTVTIHHLVQYNSTANPVDERLHGGVYRIRGASEIPVWQATAPEPKEYSVDESDATAITSVTPGFSPVDIGGGSPPSISWARLLIRRVLSSLL